MATLIALEAAHEMARMAFAFAKHIPGGGLREQLRRAAASVVLNIAEGDARGGNDRAALFRIAYASAKEVSAAVRLAGDAELAAREHVDALLRALDRVQALTWRLACPRH